MRTLAAGSGSDEPFDEVRDVPTADVSYSLVWSDAGANCKKAADVVEPSIFKGDLRYKSNAQFARSQMIGCLTREIFHSLERGVVETEPAIDEGIMTMLQWLKVRRCGGSRASGLPNLPFLLGRRILHVNLGPKGVRGGICVDVRPNMDCTVVIDVVLARGHHEPTVASVVRINGDCA